jgi:hypothetical protein
VTTDYVSLEEFTAVLVTNIVISERSRFAPLRYGSLAQRAPFLVQPA